MSTPEQIAAELANELDAELATADRQIAKAIVDKAKLADELAAALRIGHAGAHWKATASPTCRACALLARYQEASR